MNPKQINRIGEQNRNILRSAQELTETSRKLIDTAHQSSAEVKILIRLSRADIQESMEKLKHISSEPI